MRPRRLSGRHGDGLLVHNPACWRGPTRRFQCAFCGSGDLRLEVLHRPVPLHTTLGSSCHMRRLLHTVETSLHTPGRTRAGMVPGSRCRVETQCRCTLCPQRCHSLTNVPRRLVPYSHRKTNPTVASINTMAAAVVPAVQAGVLQCIDPRQLTLCWHHSLMSSTARQPSQRSHRARLLHSSPPEKRVQWRHLCWPWAGNRTTGRDVTARVRKGSMVETLAP